MTLYEVHIALARSLGDPFKETSSSTIYDGVRYSKLARQSYLYRAACSVINEAIVQALSLPTEVAARIIVKAFPSMITWRIVTIPNGVTEQVFNFYDDGIVSTSGYFDPPSRIAYIISAEVNDYQGALAFTVPIVDYYSYRRIASSGTNTFQQNDPICSIASSGIGSAGTYEFTVMLNQGSRDLSGGNFQITHLRYPLNQGLTDGTVIFDFENSFIDTIIKKATVYGMIDDGDLSAKELLPLIGK